jgi:hypothetical protein
VNDGQGISASSKGGLKMKIQIETEMVEPLNKICALADLFNAAGCDGLTLDFCSRLGVSAILRDTVNEIISIGETLTKRIAER